MLNWRLRYQPAIDLLDEFQADEVIDVGAGWHGLGRWWHGRVVQTDLYLGERPKNLKSVGHPAYARVTAEALPFADDTFDFAVSLDMMEHLPEEIRGQSVLELTRVARRGVIIGFPVGRGAHEVDRRIREACRWLRLPTPGWLAEHLDQVQYPDQRTLAGALPDSWRIARELPNGNVRVQSSLVIMELLPGLSTASHLIDTGLRHLRWMPAWVHRPPTYRMIWLLEPGQPDQSVG